jgi:uncharacterized repeat protein (TIGR03803 family)
MSEKSRTSRLLCIVNTLRKRNWRERTFTICVLCATTAIALPAQTFTTLHSFEGPDGSWPSAPLAQGRDGNLYGTTLFGGANGFGTVFKIAPGGALKTLYGFCSQNGCPDGEQPWLGLVQTANGDFYGTTGGGGVNCAPSGCGTIFRITPSGALTTVYSFCAQNQCADGDAPEAGLVQVPNGDFYGTTSGGGVLGGGTVFKITPSGALTTLHNFCFHCTTDGTSPNGLARATDGDFYGTTQLGGADGAPSGYGTVFKITPAGTLTMLHSFCSRMDCADGAQPDAGLVQGADGDLYGTTYIGGAGYGTVFKLTPSGALTTLYTFCSQYPCTDGAQPDAGLIQATDGNFYGTTSYDGASGGGTVFKIAPNGTLTTLYSFCSQSGCTDGEYPWLSSLVQATNGDLFGSTRAGGTNDTCRNGCGTVFRLSVGLGPFVETEPAAGSWELSSRFWAPI